MAVKVKERPPGSGRWWIYVDHKNQRKARYIPQGKRKAEEIASGITKKLAILEAAEKNGMSLSVHQVVLDDPSRIVPDPKSKGPTINEYSEGWLKECEAKGLKHSTMRSYRGSLKNHILPTLGGMTFEEIDRKIVKAFGLKKLAASMSSNSVRIIICCLSAIFSSANEDGIVRHNPALRPGRFMKMKGRHEDINPLTKEEEAILLKKTKAFDPTGRIHALVFFLLRTGCRIGEAAALQPGDLDFRGRFIEVKRNYTGRRITTPKNGKTRRIDMSLKLAEVLKEHLSKMEVEAIAKGKAATEWVLPSPKGTILDADYFRKVFYMILKEAGLRRIRIHDLRHTFCTRLIENRESLAYVRDQMGHSSIQVTVDIYGHLVPGSNKQAVDRLDEPLETAKSEGKSATSRNQLRQEGMAGFGNA